jgi:hypothetical protein
VSHVIRWIVAALAGAALGAGILSAAYARDPGLSFEMDSRLPAFVSGMYAGEHDAVASFAWTSGQVIIDLNDIDRRSPWSCSLRFRGPRPPGEQLPVVDVSVDNARVVSVPAAGDYHDLGFSIPPGGRLLRLSLDVSPTFTPGTADKRALGIQIDRLQCRPQGTAWAPTRPLVQAAAAAGFLAAVFVLAGFSLTVSLLSAAIVAFASATMVTTGAGVYGDYSNTVLRLTLWSVALVCGLMTGAERIVRQRFSTMARVVFAILTVAVLIKLIALMHPAKPDIDAIFHAHRLTDVIAGRRYFTQPFVGGVEMPYAIGLYVFAWPWTWLVADHTAVIRAVAAISDVAAGALLYPMLVRAWADRRAAVLAVLFYQLAPLGYAVLGNANLTNLFGQSIALAAVAAAVSWKLDLRRIGSLAAFTAIVTWAFCSHVSTITTLLATLGLLVLLYWWRGDRDRRRSAVAVVAAVAAALGLSWLVYYSEFSDEISGAFSRMFTGGTGESAATAAEAARGYMGTSDRLRDLLTQAVSSAGWPMVVLAAVGTWFAWRKRRRDRLESALLAWAIVWILLSASTVFSRVEQEFVRYTAEFLGRINLATIPLVAILAAKGAAAGWDDNTPSAMRTPLRGLAVVLIALAINGAWHALLGWFSR